MIQHREFKELIKEVQSEFPDLTVGEVEEIVRSSFEFAQDHISKGSLTPIYFQYLGRFRAKQGRIDWLEKRREYDANIERKLQTKRHSDSTPEE